MPPHVDLQPLNVDASQSGRLGKRRQGTGAWLAAIRAVLFYLAAVECFF